MADNPSPAVVVAVDFADPTDRLVREGLTIAAATGGDLVLVHAAAEEPAFVGYDTEDFERHTRDARADELTDEHRALRELAERTDALAPTISVRSLLAMGPTAETLLRVADDVGAGHLVIGSHGRGRLHHLLVGSVAEELLRRTTVTLVVVPVRST
ncbi:universal stress protein [Rhabdothermincola salaria]|uniref:universal stress protein n=1 Tax=Rhabdothermincola salaria TaxID=2903142 RepID=UPI001E3B167C|nr:universal stress protein [Rhabdothermincola salaria]